MTAISPTSGPTTGGTSVTISGTLFTGVTAVDFGGVAASYTFNSDSSITATAPTGSGTVDVTVTTPSATSATSSADQFTYLPAPSVTSISPTSGPAAGGTNVTINGANLSGVTAVNFGGSAATFTLGTATQMTANAPGGSGTVDVTVTSGGGTSAISSADQFTYIQPLTLTPTASAKTQVGQTYSQANDAGGGTPAYSYSLFAGALPAGTMLNTTTGVVSGTPITAGAFSYTIEVTDSGNPQLTAMAVSSGTIVPATLTLTATASSTTQVGQSYSQTNAAGGGTVPYTFVISGGTLPAGTTLDYSTGTVSGTPTTAGAFSYTIKLTDSGNPMQTATQVDSGTIAPAALALAATAASRAQVGQFYRQTNVASGGTAPYTYSLFAGSLPAGTRLDASTGTVFGSPTTGGAFSYTIEATDSGSPAQTATQVVSGTIASGPTAPTVTAVSPNGGPLAGGTTVMITGTNLTGATAVNFGGSSAKQFAVNSATEVSAIAPPGTVGTVDVTVTTGNGTSAVSAADQFSYTSAHSTQRGDKLVGSGYSGAAEEAFAVALTPDGNTAVIGGFADNANAGAAWVFSRSGGTWTQLGGKLLGSGASGNAEQGYSAAISGDGNTMLVGGPADNGNAGAAWVFVQSGGSWMQQGAKLAPSDETGAGQFGVSVSLSNDGNTALIGGSADNSGAGAVWVFTRSGSTWTESTKLTATDESGAGQFGSAVSVSSNAGTALIGGAADNANNGAAWVFTQTAGVWTQDGLKLVGTGNIGAADQGYSVALAADGNTALVGGFADNSDAGAAWVFTQSGGVWSQQGSKLTGTGAAGAARQGFAVALSGDASTAALGGYEDNAFAGAAWVFTQNGGTWSQHGAKLVGTGASGGAEQGMALALSSNGGTLIAGGPFDGAGTGAAWVFTPGTLAATHDFNGDGTSDILWKATSGDPAMWLISAGQFSSGAALGNVGTSWSVAGTRDFNGDGYADILWLDGSGDLALWLMDGTSVSSFNSLGNVGTQWAVAGTGDFNGDGTGDILWRNSTTGDLAVWLMSNGTFSSSVDLGVMPSNWQVAGTGDFNGDGTTDILWRNTSNGALAIWFMSNGQMSSSVGVGSVPTGWTVVGTGDFNGDGVSDILWRDSSGDAAIWLMNSSGQMASGAGFAGIPATWSVAETGDFNGDGKSDILWIDQSGDLGVWLMNGLTVSSSIGLGNVGTTWAVQGQNAD